MSDVSIIGAVDLTVHLSSMNPLGHIDARNANKVFERSLINASWATANESNNKAPLLDAGIIVEGPGAKYFHFKDKDDLIFFCAKVRGLLIEERLPFKICVRTGALTTTALADRWSPIVDKAKSGDVNARHSLLSEFNTYDEDDIKEIFKLYRAPGFKNDAVELSLDIEGFKGLGVFIDKSMIDIFQDNDRFFLNSSPTKIGRPLSEFTTFIDCKFDFEEEDVVLRFADKSGQHNQTLSGGAIAVIEGGFELLKRSFNANSDNGIYYLSFLMTIVRSSPFSKIMFLREKILETETGWWLAPGWQNDPIIFGAIFDPNYRQMLKSINGIEYILGALIDEVFSAISGSVASSSINAPKVVTDDEINKAVLSDVFIQTVLRVQNLFGKTVMRKLYKLPDTILLSGRKKAILSVASS